MAEDAQPKKVFVAATRQDQGKTTVSLGLMAAFNEMLAPAGFIKPVGQRYVEVDGVRVDEDVALMRAVFASDCALADMSPVTIGRSFTRDYINHPQPDLLAHRILESYEHMAAGKRSVIIEGTGHAGVGSCFDTSNADVAKLLGAKVVLVTTGGIGRPIDEVMLNEALFRDRGVQFLGVILNKVLPDKLEEIRGVVGRGLARKGIDLLGCVPYERLLAIPSMRLVYQEISGELINGESFLDNTIEDIIVGAMVAHRALDYIRPHCLLITPGDRDDLILAAMSIHTLGAGGSVSGMLLTGGVRPHRNILRLLAATEIPVILVEQDSYSAAAQVNELKVKIQPTDTEKIATVPKLVREHVDVQRIVERL